MAPPPEAQNRGWLFSWIKPVWDIEVISHLDPYKYVPLEMKYLWYIIAKCHFSTYYECMQKASTVVACTRPETVHGCWISAVPIQISPSISLIVLSWQCLHYIYANMGWNWCTDLRSKSTWVGRNLRLRQWIFPIPHLNQFCFSYPSVRFSCCWWFSFAMSTSR